MSLLFYVSHSFYHPIPQSALSLSSPPPSSVAALDGWNCVGSAWRDWDLWSQRNVCFPVTHVPALAFYTNLFIYFQLIFYCQSSSQKGFPWVVGEGMSGRGW